MDTTRLRYFCAVANTGNIHRAAKLLGISAAALSKAVRLLESEVELKLIAPSGRGIVITEDGKAFAARAIEVLTEIDKLAQSAKAAGKVKRPLRAGSFEVFTTHCLGPLLRELDGADLELILHELTPGKLEEGLVDGKIDLGITYLPIPVAGLDFLKVTTIEMGVFGSRKAFTNLPLSEVPFVVPVTPLQGTPSKVVGLDGWPDNLVRRRVKYRVTLMESALELCRFGLAVAFLPRFVVELHNAKVREDFRLSAWKGPLPLKGKYIHQPVYLVKRKGDVEGPQLKKLARALRLVCRHSSTASTGMI